MFGIHGPTTWQNMEMGEKKGGGMGALCVGTLSLSPPPPHIFILVHVVQLPLYFYFTPQDGSAGQST